MHCVVLELKTIFWAAEEPQPFYCLQSETSGPVRSSLRFLDLLTNLKCRPLDRPCEVLFSFFGVGFYDKKHRKPRQSHCLAVKETGDLWPLKGICQHEPKIWKAKQAKGKKKNLQEKKKRPSSHHSGLLHTVQD